MNGISSATVASFTAALYFGLAIGTHAVRWSPLAPNPLLPGMAAVLYVIIAAVVTRRAPVARRLGAVVTLLVAHAALVGGTAYVWTLGTKATFDAMLPEALWRFSTAVILQAFCVPVLTWPLTSFFAQPRVVRRVKPRSRRGPAPLPRAQAVAWPGQHPGEMATSEMADSLAPVEADTTVAVAVAQPAAPIAAAPIVDDVPAPTLPFAPAPASAAEDTVTEPRPVRTTSSRRHRDEDESTPPVAGARPERTAPASTSATAPRPHDADTNRARASLTDTPARTRVEASPPRGATPPPRSPAVQVPESVGYAPFDPATPSIRIPFTAIADQIPHDVLATSATKIASALPQSGYVVVPEALVVNQIVEGLVRIAWDVVARQLPDTAFAGSRSAAARRLADVAIELPLADVVSQLSPELFADAKPVEAVGIEGFPMPFLPASESDATDDDTAAFDDGAADEDIDEPAVAVADDYEDTPVDPGATEEVVAETTIPTDEWEDDDPDDAGAVEGPPTPEVRHELTALTPVAMDHAGLASPRNDARAVSTPVSLTSGEIRTLFARLDRFDIDTEIVDGVTLYRLVGPDVPADALRDVAAQLGGPLRKGWSGRGLDQITVRGATTAVVLTALGDPDGAGAILVAGTRRGPGLALVELLGRRGAAAWSTTRGATHGAGLPDEELVEPIEGEDLARIAAGLGAFGTVAGRCFAGDAALVYAFVDPAVEGPDVAEFARELVDAVASAGVAELEPIESVSARCGAEQLVVRPVVRARGVPRLVVAAGPVERPGLAQHQVERAAALLASEAV